MIEGEIVSRMNELAQAHFDFFKELRGQALEVVPIRLGIQDLGINSQLGRESTFPEPRR